MSLQLSELERIKGLPRCNGPTPEEALLLQQEWVQPESYAKGFRLLEGQVYGLWSWLRYGGLMGALGVGQGKTLLSLMIASDFHRKNPGSNSMILLPPDLVRQLWVQDLPWAKKHFLVDLPIVSLGKQRPTMRKALCAGVRGRCFLYPYSLLSTRDGQELPRLIDADLVIADEAHCLTGDSARSRRWWDWVTRTRAENPPIGVCLSGTLLRRGVLDYYQLAKWSLAERSPLPRAKALAMTWAEGLQSVHEGVDWVPEQSSRALGPLCRWAGVEFLGRPRLRHCQEAYRRRLYSTPGFVPPARDTVGASLRIYNHDLTDKLEPGNDLTAMMRDVERDWATPDGEPILYALEMYELLRELSAGIWLKRYWPDRPGAREAKKAWDARGDWLRELRGWHSSRHRPPLGLDTPGLVHQALLERTESIERLPAGIVELWGDWQALLLEVPEGAPGRSTEVRRVDPFKVDAIKDWCLAGKKSNPRRMGGIIWVEHICVADWVEETLRETGELRVLRKNAGANWLRDDGSEKYWCVASIAAHSTGRNLQHLAAAQWVYQLPGPKETEQMLGRVHREGVEQYGVDVVEVQTCLTTPWDWEQARKTLRITRDYAALHGGAGKLISADYCPPWV